ncbi:MAG: aldo/keto reductase [Anaerolineales bacterium]|nr:aldo/keto reductase [Anaerolineales bacterium]
MHYRRLGRSGLKVSEISLGAWVTFGNQIGYDTADMLLKAAYERGINFFDNADIYAQGKAEEVMGKSIKGIPRNELVISSKVFWPTMQGPNGRGLSRKHITESIHASLKRLDTDYVDLYFCHRYDPDSPIEEVVDTMNILIQQGKILYWGTSEWRASQIAMAYGYAKQNNLIAPVVEQPQYHLFHRRRVEAELSSITEALGIGLVTWSPLAGGLLTGKYNNGIPEGSRASLQDMSWMKDHITKEKVEKVVELEKVAKEMGATMAQLAIAWLLRRKDVTSVITGATKLSQLEDNIRSSEFVEKLTDPVLQKIEDIVDNDPEE